MMLEVDGIDTFYGETQALFGVSLDVRAGEVVALLGPNGAGKTTTLRSILGLTPARAGSIRFDGHDITRAPTHEIARRGIGWVPDDRRIFPTLTVARNLSIARKKTRFRGWTDKECFEIFSGARIPHASRMRKPVGRGDADGRHLARTGRRAGPRALRRAEPGPGAQGRPGRDAHDPPPARAKASRSSSSSKTCEARSTSPIASMS